MAAPGFAQNVDAVASGAGTVVDYTKTGGDAIHNSISEAVNDSRFWAAMTGPIVIIVAVVCIAFIIRDPSAALQLLKEPGALRDIGIAFVTVTLLLLIYVYLLRPEIRIGKMTTIAQLCPDRWVYEQKTQKCEPRYKTKCVAFSPKDPNLQSYASQCEFARACGTDWAGVCN